MRLRILLFTTLAGLALLLAALPAQAAGAQQGEDGDPELGARLFAENCAVCHGETGEGRVGATLSDVFVSMSPDAALTEVITNGRPGTYMPAWGREAGGPLTGEDIANLVAYIESWGTTYEPVFPAPPRPAVEIPPVEELAGDPNNGYTIYQQNCAACHGPDGEGRIGATLTSAFVGIEPGAYAVQTISRGIDGTLMPAWSQEAGGPLTAGEIEDVTAYLASIQRSQAPPAGEQPLAAGSSLPLILIALGGLVIIVGLGVAVNRREKNRAGQ